MRVLVTGGTGFIGSNLVQELIKQGHEVLITGHDAEQTIPDFSGTILQPSLVGIDFERLGQIDVCFHQAAINDTTLMDRDEMFRANVTSSIQLFKKLIENGCKRIVYASSTAAYGDAAVPFKEDGEMRPMNPYGESKKRLEEEAMILAAQNPGVVFVGLRYCNIYGPGENHKGPRASMIYQLAQQMKENNPKLFKMGEQKREWVYVKDVVKANLLASKARRNSIVNVATGTATTFNKIVEVLNNAMGTSRTIEYIDNPHEAYQNHTECDMSHAKDMIGFEADYDVEAGIKDYFESGKLC
ncbi:MAG: NAD-dependent epimerase/dehydratase family protein [Candidatus Woesearchaeota archaeon]|jgi:ADP-L-glycero-D-manno-heptose 6-epimerase|nr:NAD-dependent epimerase/dehydratase family protein [Candidatus Woesearchaeota archaeon]MDP7181481.1 NAD-dependent epimerase/dehydratase family protein [Candidatus Woesearchaeota archaeon]MDP7198523.1 NAD-dependent epimerase/dehydratase family protein [Candidatus Woesearchaeota archaeon]MDP7466735.1 NAD-dependent epimerase/dehydratase family protein [Candidatus Woesearchaeota archaeon]MDP7647960.1 NAD-dependent epimerase/dehydratase family protein [Candidatus Woesearchaeota archaeon]